MGWLVGWGQQGVSSRNAILVGVVGTYKADVEFTKGVERFSDQREISPKGLLTFLPQMKGLGWEGRLSGCSCAGITSNAGNVV